MKKIVTIFALAAVSLGGCKKSDLQLNNPNSPTPTEALAAQKGIENFALGMWNKLYVGNNLLAHTLVMHSIMGDEQFSSVGNFGWRYVNQTDYITIPAPYNRKIRNPLELSQPAQLKALNTLPATNGSATNSIVYEWNMAYYVNGQANLLLQTINAGTVTLPATEKAVLTAWAYWWKGFAYSRVGSMYVAGVINNSTDGTTSPSYVGRDAIIAEANSNFDKAAAALAPIAASDAVYTTTMNLIIPTFNRTNPIVSPAMWIRGINTLKARNLMVNKKVTQMTAADWNNVKTLTTAGLIAGDRTFVLGMDAGGVNDLTPNSQQHPYGWNSNKNNPGWVYPSERWIQDFKAGDQRFTKGVTAFAANEVVQNRSSRGLQYGTRYYLTPIESGGYWSTNNRSGQVQFAGSYEENALMLAEANMRTGDLNGGLALVDQVRTANGAGLTAVAGTGLNQDQALEELRKERRIALTYRGLAFYDARRWNVTAPVSAGGGRANANVIVPNSVIGITPAASWTLIPCLIEYNYMDYWDVPVTEFSYNVPDASSVPIAAN